MSEKKPTNKKEKFKSIAEPRLERAAHNILLLIPLSDKNRYEYSDEQVKYILKTLKDSVRQVENAFDGKSEKTIRMPE